MKKGYAILFVLILVAFIFNVSSIYYSIKVYKALKEPALSSRVSATGELNLTVETAPSGTTEPSPSGGTSGGGGGGGGTMPAPKFTVFPDVINIDVSSGQTVSREIAVKNTGGETIIIDIGISAIGSIASLDTSRIVIRKGETKNVTATFNALQPGIYAGKIVFKSGKVIKESLILINVASEGVLFDVSITVPEAYKIIRAGQNLPTLVELLQIGQEQGLDVILNYVVKDFDGNTIYTESESLYVLGTKTFNKQFLTHALLPGDYVVGVELVYSGGFATSSAHFRVQQFKISWLTILALILAFISGILVLLAIIYYRRRKEDKYTELINRQ